MLEYQKSPFHILALEGNLTLFKKIAGMSGINNHLADEDHDGYTPLHLAARMNHFKIFKLIIYNVVDKNPANNYGDTQANRIPGMI